MCVCVCVWDTQPGREREFKSMRSGSGAMIEACVWVCVREGGERDARKRSLCVLQEQSLKTLLAWGLMSLRLDLWVAITDWQRCRDVCSYVCVCLGGEGAERQDLAI